MGSKLLIDDYPIQVLPKLAEEIGLNEAIILQQLHYWLNSKNAHIRDGKRWVYNTYEGWKKQFPFWSVATIKRILTSLSKQKLIYKNNFNRAGFDKTVWYSINYEVLKQVSQRLGQNDLTRGSNCTNGEGQNDLTNTIDYTETTTETNVKHIVEQQHDNTHTETYKIIISYLNIKAGTNFKYSTKTTQNKIQARLNDGFTVDDFKKVIDTKVKSWGRDQTYSKYLRPETLFGSKFESYLNESELTSNAKGTYSRDDSLDGLPF